MKPEEALELLNQAVAQINTSRQLHIQLQQAIECLSEVLPEPSETDKDLVKD